MKTKFIFISGGVISGIGKGVVSASISFILKRLGFNIVPVKCENYLNVDAGTINPIEHGDVFLCADGTEADMDLGSYEKFLGEEMGKINFVTMGQIYKTVIEKERRFEYEGEDVEAIPHITNEIQNRWLESVKTKKAEIAVIELGGTVGEYQNVLYYEAARILALKNPRNVFFVHVAYMPIPKHLGEPKTKPIQLSVKTLNSMGIQPDFLIVRSERPIDKRRKERLALFCNMYPEDIFSSPDLDIVYEVPLYLLKQKFDERLLLKLKEEKRQYNFENWEELVEKVKNIEKKIPRKKIAIVGKYFKTGEYELRDAYAALFDAIDHASYFLGEPIETVWIDAEKVEKDGPEKYLKDVNGIIVPIGWGERGAEGMIKTASYAREKKIPYLGLCYGMQLAVVAFARDVLGWKNANTEENDPNTPYPVIHIIPEQKRLLKKRAYGGTMRLGNWRAKVKKGTLAWKIYEKYNWFEDQEKGIVVERHRHRYEVNDKYSKDFEKAGLIISARSVDEGLIEMIELPQDKHPFYFGTQGHPEYRSTPLKPHPVFIEFLKVVLKEND